MRSAKRAPIIACSNLSFPSMRKIAPRRQSSLILNTSSPSAFRNDLLSERRYRPRIIFDGVSERRFHFRIDASFGFACPNRLPLCIKYRFQRRTQMLVLRDIKFKEKQMRRALRELAHNEEGLAIESKHTTLVRESVHEFPVCRISRRTRRNEIVMPKNAYEGLHPSRRRRLASRAQGWCGAQRPQSATRHFLRFGPVEDAARRTETARKIRHLRYRAGPCGACTRPNQCARHDASHRTQTRIGVPQWPVFPR